MLQRLKKCPTKVQQGLGELFFKWGGVVNRCSVLTFILALLGFAYASSGVRFVSKYTNEDLPFTPEVSNQIDILMFAL